MKFPAIFRKRQQTEATLNVEVLSAKQGRSMDVSDVASRYAIRSLVDADMRIVGNIVSKTGAALSGKVDGNVTIIAPNAALLVRTGAKIKGIVRAPILMVSGEVEGMVIARLVRVYAGGVLRGPIRAERIIIDDGATVQNSSVVAGPASEPKTPATAGDTPVVAIEDARSAKSG